MCELTVAVLALTNPTYTQPRQNPNTEKGDGYEAPPLAERLLAVGSSWGMEISFAKGVTP